MHTYVFLSVSLNLQFCVSSVLHFLLLHYSKRQNNNGWDVDKSCYDYVINGATARPLIAIPLQFVAYLRIVHKIKIYEDGIVREILIHYYRF